MKKSALLILTSFSLALAACEMPDIAGLNSMPKKTGEMSDKMDTTNEAIHKQTLLLALTELNKPENQDNIVPVPTGLMPAGKVFAEEARPDELIELTYNNLIILNENEYFSGIDGDGGTVSPTDQELASARKKRMAQFWALAIIAGFTQDAKVEEIIRHDIEGNGRFQDAALSFLALRAYFLREVLLNLSLKVNQTFEDKDLEKKRLPTLDNSGKMNEAVKYLQKLDKITELKFRKPIQFHIASPGGLFAADFVMDEEAKDTTAQYWINALDNATQGAQFFTASSTAGAADQAEVAAQHVAMSVMKSYVSKWQGFHDAFQKQKAARELEEQKRKEEEEKRLAEEQKQKEAEEAGQAGGTPAPGSSPEVPLPQDGKKS